MVDLPVEWFDCPEPVDVVSNNDLPGTESHWADYAPFWDTERDWVEPHPDMDGWVCSTGFRHVAQPVPLVPPVGLARIDPRSGRVVHHSA